MRHTYWAAILAACLLLSACAASGSGSSSGAASSAGMSSSAASSSGEASGSAPASSAADSGDLSAEQALALLEETLGEKDAATGNPFSIGPDGTVEVEGAAWYNFRVSWLVDGNHLSYLTNYLVSPQGEIREYLPPELGGAGALTVRETADLYFDLLRADPAALAPYIDPERGLTFTPYTTVTDADRTVSAADFAAFFTDDAVYTWGIWDGIGEDIDLTGGEYWERFVWNSEDDGRTPDAVTEGALTQVGNSIDNLDEAYGDCAYIDYHFAGQTDGAADPAAEDWCGWFSLTLVLRQADGQWYLTGLVHSEATV